MISFLVDTSSASAALTDDLEPVLVVTR